MKSILNFLGKTLQGIESSAALSIAKLVFTNIVSLLGIVNGQTPDAVMIPTGHAGIDTILESIWKLVQMDFPGVADDIAEFKDLLVKFSLQFDPKIDPTLVADVNTVIPPVAIAATGVQPDSTVTDQKPAAAPAPVEAAKPAASAPVKSGQIAGELWDTTPHPNNKHLLF